MRIKKHSPSDLNMLFKFQNIESLATSDTPIAKSRI